MVSKGIGCAASRRAGQAPSCLATLPTRLLISLALLSTKPGAFDFPGPPQSLARLVSDRRAARLGFGLSALVFREEWWCRGLGDSRFAST